MPEYTTKYHQLEGTGPYSEAPALNVCLQWRVSNITSGIDSMWNVQNEWCLDAVTDLQRDSFLLVLSAYEPSRRLKHWPGRIWTKCSTNCLATLVTKFKKNNNYLIDSSKTFCRFYPASRLRSGAIWGRFFFFFFTDWLSDITSQLLRGTHSHHDLVGQEFTPISKKKWDKSHHTRYGHTNERTTSQIFMKCFPNGNI